MGRLIYKNLLKPLLTWTRRKTRKIVKDRGKVKVLKALPNPKNILNQG